MTDLIWPSDLRAMGIKIPSQPVEPDVNKRQELSADPGTMLFVYVRETAAGRLVRVAGVAENKIFKDNDNWLHVATLQPRAFIEQILNDNKAIFDSVFKK